jgi:nicotinamidase/pyrazinamidase
MVKKKAVFWDVDTQFDFLNPKGKLYVPSSDQIIDSISQIRKFALENGCSIIASADWHKPSDEEISLTPDFKHTFPQHCLAAEPGSKRVGFLGQLPIEYVELGPMNQTELRKLVEKEPFHIVIRKSKFDVFSNPNTVKLLNLVKPQMVVVFGVALDVCVCHAVCGLLSWGKTTVTVLKDGVKGLGIKPDEQILKEFEQDGVKIAQLKDLERGF